ncbi:MAG: ATP-binding protein [Candidatus Rokuibacteriota bacterium]
MLQIKRIAFAPFSALSFVCIVAMAVVMGYALSFLLTRAVSEWEWQNTAALVRREVRMAKLETVFDEPGSLEARERWGREFSRILTSLPEVVRAKVWNRNAEILWSDERHLIGQRFPDNDELQHALAGEIKVEIKRLAKSEQRYEQAAYRTLAEVYVPIRVGESGPVLGVVEVYKTPDRLLAAIRWSKLVIWTISLAGGIALYLVLMPLFTQVYRRQVEEETLRQHAARLQTEVDQRTRELLHAQKMQAIGLLAGGIAHDFNNLLTVVIGRCQLLLTRCRPDDPVRPDLNLIESTALRAASLTRQLLAFSRKQVLEQQVLDVNSVVADMGKMLRRVIGENIALVTALAPTPCRVDADRAQLEQVILNLVVNARDAMPHGGELSVEAASIDVDGPAGDGRHLPPGRYVRLAVRDTGVGMDAATRARIFEPFFTTKDVGKGTGLGLSTAYGVVQQHGGNVVVHSAVGHGSTFEVYLPRTDAALPVPAAGPDIEALTGSETILVVEDEKDVRDFVSETLRAGGYAVLVARDGLEALEAAERWAGPIDLLLTDIVMPGPSGWEVARRLTSTHAEMRVLYMTGYSEIPIASEGPLLQKPFTPLGLARAVRERLMGLQAVTPPAHGGD